MATYKQHEHIQKWTVCVPKIDAIVYFSWIQCFVWKLFFCGYFFINKYNIYEYLLLYYRLKLSLQVNRKHLRFILWFCTLNYLLSISSIHDMLFELVILQFCFSFFRKFDTYQKWTMRNYLTESMRLGSICH